MQEKGRLWIEESNVRLADKVLKDTTRQDSTLQFKKETQIKSNIIKYISSNSTLQCNLTEGPFIYKITDQDIQLESFKI